MTTTCLFPPELDDKQLLAHLDNPDANPETARHLEKCPYCRARAEALDGFQRRLTSRLYRITCPSPVELGEYHLHTLPAPQMLIISQHLRECPHCTREVAELEEYLGLPEQSRRRLFARLVSGPGMASASPALSGLRGDQDEPFVFEVDDVQISIDVEDDADQIGAKSLVGLVTGLKTNHFTIQIIQQGQVLAAKEVDQSINFTIPDLTTGIYTLLLIGPNDEIQTESLTIK